MHESFIYWFLLGEPARLAGLTCYTSLARLMPYFFIKLSSCLYEKEGWPPCRDTDSSIEPTSRDEGHTTTILRGNKA